MTSREQVLSLEDACEFVRDGTHGSPQRVDNGIPVLSARNVHEGSLDLATDRYTTEAELSAFRARVPVGQGDVLLTIVGSIGRAAVVETDSPFVLQRSVAVLRPRQNCLDPAYLRRALDAPDAQSQLMRMTNTSAQPGVYLGKLGHLAIPVPPLPEQRRIAAILDKADTVRRKRQQTLDLADQFLRSTFLDMFGDPVKNPKGWPVRKLGELLTFLTSGSRGWGKHYSDEGAAFLRIQNVGQNRLLLDDLARVVPPDVKEAERTRLQAGDVVLSITADLGRAAVIPKSLGPAHVNQHLGLLRVEGVEPLYLAEFLITDAAQLQFRALDTGQTRSGLNFDDLKRLKVPLPPTELQDGFALLHSKAASVRASVDRILQVTVMLAGSLTQRAFRGGPT